MIRKRNKDRERFALTEKNLVMTIKEEKPDFKIEKREVNRLANFTFCRQAEFGKGLNCSITTLAAVINYLQGNQTDITDIYKYVRKLASFFLYNPRVIGTISFAIGPMYSIAKRHFKLPGRVRTAYLKNVGYDFEKIRKQIDQGKPVILNIFRDGRNFYKNHTVIVIGYKVYYCKGEKFYYLMVNDNWAKQIRYVDYQKLSILSSVNY